MPPAPVRMATEAEGSASKASKAARRASAVAPSTAFRRSGRLMVTVVTGPSAVTSMVCTTAFSQRWARARKVTPGVDN